MNSILNKGLVTTVIFLMSANVFAGGPISQQTAMKLFHGLSAEKAAKLLQINGAMFKGVSKTAAGESVANARSLDELAEVTSKLPEKEQKVYFRQLFKEAGDIINPEGRQEVQNALSELNRSGGVAKVEKIRITGDVKSGSVDAVAKNGGTSVASGTDQAIKILEELEKKNELSHENLLEIGKVRAEVAVHKTVGDGNSILEGNSGKVCGGIVEGMKTADELKTLHKFAENNTAIKDGIARRCSHLNVKANFNSFRIWRAAASVSQIKGLQITTTARTGAQVLADTNRALASMTPQELKNVAKSVAEDALNGCGPCGFCGNRSNDKAFITAESEKFTKQLTEQKVLTECM